MVRGTPRRTMLGLLIDALWPWTISCAALAGVPLDMAQMGWLAGPLCPLTDESRKAEAKVQLIGH